ncbi:anthranilate synthase component I [Bacillus swezeyi]|uniref:Anthranilate synthase component 1 n=1 Tax=Bacillus swezeyi TaxID=1925020 RepID=A0A5M8RXV3_9BACI|nr:anthranilate synthase component I [Bacillus swezeyi]KAA6451674.1 anthranilate synthase component I [Bacillus swezeyi]TYS35901.1 anthranilate synthase component I [Bacillus swezeyi]
MSFQTDFSSFMEDTSHFKTIPIIESFSVDTLTPVQMVETLQDDIVYLLESKDDTSAWSRYSFIGLNPFLTIQEERGQFHVCGEEMEKLYTASQLKEVLQWMSDTCFIKAPDLDIPFTGGAVGYLSYDLMSLLEPSIAKHTKETEMAKCLLYVCRTMIVYDHELKKLHFIQYVRLNGSETKEEKALHFQRAKRELKKLIQRLSDGKTAKELFLPQGRHGTPSFEHVQSTYEKSQFLADVERLKAYIKAGDIFQGVLSQRFDIPVKVSSFALYRVLRMINPSPYMYYIKLPDRELVGSSPERLIHVQNGHLEIHPIAGTRKRGRDRAEDERLQKELLADEKEKAEHYMLVDLARNDIGRVAEYGSVQVPEFTKIVSFSHVMHIISIVTGSIKAGVHPADALMSAFPAGTLTGAPKIRAMQLLNELEPAPRETYGGCIAYIGFDGNIDSCITIRTMSVKNGVASIQSGAGVVADSVPEKEWEETCNKAGALLKTIQIAEEMFLEKEEGGNEQTVEIMR